MKKFFTLVLVLFTTLLISAQNIGVGTVNPTEKFQVVGNIKADTLKPNAIKLATNAGEGKVLTSDATGNAQWQAKSTSTTGGGVGFGSWGDCSMNGVSEYNPVTDPDPSINDNFGYSVSISGNFAIVGAEGDDCCGQLDRGSVSFYRHDGSKWVFMQKLIDPDGAADDRFGSSVAISGNYAIVGARLDDCCGGANQGSVSAFQFNGTSWVLMAKWFDPDGNNGDVFGSSVSISGNYALIGALGDDIIPGDDKGSASVFQLINGSWTFMQKITDQDGSASDYFGASVSISGNSLIVGAYGDDYLSTQDVGSASIFQFNGSIWVLRSKKLPELVSYTGHFGYSVSISGNHAVVGQPLLTSASVYRYDGSAWVLMTLLSQSNGIATNTFASSVAISGDYIIIGEKSYQPNISNELGGAYIYLRVGLGWQKVQFITDPSPKMYDKFGHATAIDGQRFLIGAHGYTQSSGKAIFGKVN